MTTTVFVQHRPKPPLPESFLESGKESTGLSKNRKMFSDEFETALFPHRVAARGSPLQAGATERRHDVRPAGKTSGNTHVEQSKKAPHPDHFASLRGTSPCVIDMLFVLASILQHGIHTQSGAGQITFRRWENLKRFERRSLPLIQGAWRAATSFVTRSCRRF